MTELDSYTVDLYEYAIAQTVHDFLKSKKAREAFFESLDTNLEILLEADNNDEGPTGAGIASNMDSSDSAILPSVLPSGERTTMTYFTLKDEENSTAYNVPFIMVGTADDIVEYLMEVVAPDMSGSKYANHLRNGMSQLQTSGSLDGVTKFRLEEIGLEITPVDPNVLVNS